MRLIRTLLLTLTFLLILPFISCDDNGDFLLFSIEDDMQLGKQVDEEIESMPEEFPILSRTQYAEAYGILDGMMDEILSSDQITYKDEFAWELHIIDDDQTLNAFATPGGYIYVYTGLIYFLDHADDLAGVLGHEVAHSDQRHSSKQLQRQYGISVLLSIVSGQDASNLSQIVGQLAGTLGGLAFSRSAESEADDFSVEYLSDTRYACNGAASFFEKLIANQDTRNPEFLSTHPNPDNRVEEINATAASIGCSTALSDADESDLDALKDLLP